MICVLLTSVLSHFNTATGGDEDERPPYMIYIDPETGKYTTEDPMLKSTNVGTTGNEVINGAESNPIAGTLVSAFLAISLFLILRHRRASEH